MRFLKALGTHVRNSPTSTSEKENYMKRKLAIVALLLCSTIGLLAQDGVVISSKNAQQVALLRWYQANQAQTVFQAGGYPIAAAFDGQSIWVANANSNNIMRFRSSDGALLGTYAAGSVPSGVAFDGSNIWVTSQGGILVYKFQASTGALLATIEVGFPTLGIAFDGTNIWVADYNSSGFVTGIVAK